MTEKAHILIVEDDSKLREMLIEYFESQDFLVSGMEDGRKAGEFILKEEPDIVLLDLMLPGDDGLSICRQIRSLYTGKIVMLTASDDDFDHVAALEIGADDFITKPIKPRVLLARIRMLLRRQEIASAEKETHILEYGSLSINKSHRTCLWQGDTVMLTDSEFELFWLLASSPDEVLSRDVLTRAIRGIDYDGIDRTVDNKIVTLRKKLGDDSSSPKRILTIRGKGYLFVPDAWS